MYQFDEETDKSHDAEADRGRNRNLLELAPVGLGAALDQPDRVLGEGTARLVDLGNLVHDLTNDNSTGKHTKMHKFHGKFRVFLGNCDARRPNLAAG